MEKGYYSSWAFFINFPRFISAECEEEALEFASKNVDDFVVAVHERSNHDLITYYLGPSAIVMDMTVARTTPVSIYIHDEHLQ